MVECDVCGKKLKDTRGLAGHRQFAHGIPAGGQYRLEQPDRLVTQSVLEQRIARLEQLLGELKLGGESEMESVKDYEIERLKEERRELKEQLREAVDEAKGLQGKLQTQELPSFGQLIAHATSGNCPDHAEQWEKLQSDVAGKVIAGLKGDKEAVAKLAKATGVELMPEKIVVGEALARRLRGKG